MENLDAWTADYRARWLAHLEATGTTDFKQYVRPHNEMCPSGPGIDLAQSRLILISTAGGYLPASQTPFDAASLYGDYTLRTFAQTTALGDLAFAQDHYDHAAVDADPQVLLPLRHLEDLAAEGVVGALAANVVSFSGYQPDASRVVAELVPAVLDVVRKEEAHAALLVPA